MFSLALRRLPSLSALLLAVLLGSFCAASAIETAEGETSVEESEEAILRQDERRDCQQSVATYQASCCRNQAISRMRRSSRYFFSEYASHNGIGRPLTL